MADLLPLGANVAHFRGMFPEFNPPAVADGDIQVWLKVAARFVDVRLWSADDAVEAIMYYTAHMLALKQMQKETGATDLYTHTISIDGRRVGFGQRTDQGKVGTQAPGESMLSYTFYGQMFLLLRARNIAAIALV